MQERISALNWPLITQSLNEKGYAIVPDIITDNEYNELIKNYSNNSLYRKTVVMARHRFGLGEYKYYKYPLPNIISDLRQTIYPYLVPIANMWNEVLKIPVRYPDKHEELQWLCAEAGQKLPTALILQYGEGGFNTLHQDLYGDVYFPLQTVFFLNQPDVDYTGGEFVLTQQIPRAQSKAIVLKPQKGDMMIFTTNFKPEKGTKGYYRMKMKHGVSQVRSGQRHTLGIIFHDAQT